MNIKSIIKPLIPRKILGIYHKIKHPYGTLYFQVHLTYHCNLKCKSCSHFSPLSEVRHMDIEIFNKDLNRISKLGKNNVHQIDLLGGEPLLHPEVNDFMRITRKYFPKTEIVLLTNGILLPEMPNKFWEVCKKERIVLFISYYPIKINMKLIKEKANEYNVSLRNDSNTTNRWFGHFKMDFKGEQNEYDNVKLCFESKYCHCLDNGKMYLCYLPACINIFNDFFSKSIPVCNSDYIDIYKAKSLKEIIKYMEKPMIFCKYCDVKNRYCTEWGTSKKILDEWT